MNVHEILMKYGVGAFSLEEANKELKAINAGFSLDPYKHYFSPDEVMNATAGLLFTGTGYPDKVEIVHCDDGSFELTHDVNQVNEDGSTNMRCTCYAAGKFYEVKGRKLVEC